MYLSSVCELVPSVCQRKLSRVSVGFDPNSRRIQSVNLQLFKSGVYDAFGSGMLNIQDSVVAEEFSSWSLLSVKCFLDCVSLDRKHTKG